MKLTAEFDADAVNKTSTAQRTTRWVSAAKNRGWGGTELLQLRHNSSPAVWPDHETVAGSFISFS